MNISQNELEWRRASSRVSETFRHNGEFQEQGNVEQQNNINKLPYFKASILATILEDAILQLRILDACNTDLRLNKTMMDMAMLLAEKYGVEKKSVKNELDEIDPRKLHCTKYKLDKLRADRDFVLSAISETYQHLCVERDFQSLINIVRQIVQRNVRRSHLAEEEQRNKMLELHTLRRESNRQLRQLRNHIKSVTYDTNGEIEFLKSQVEDAELKAHSRGRYAEGWQRARTEQLERSTCDKEAVPTRAIIELKRKVEQEQRVHTEIELHTTIKINELLEQVEEWMAKYEKDMEKIDLNIQLIKNDYQNMLHKNGDIEDMIKEHTEMIKKWVDFKGQREAARNYYEKMNNSAITIQAWWRGLLVRNQLGTYKPVKKKGAPKRDTLEKPKKK